MGSRRRGPLRPAHVEGRQLLDPLHGQLSGLDALLADPGTEPHRFTVDLFGVTARYVEVADSIAVLGSSPQLGEGQA